jgi:predicted nucleic-acid-binding Zn-ribbon protein
MKASQSCPKCQSTKIVYFPQIYDKDYDRWNNSLIIGTRAGFFGPKGGELEAYACKECGYTEFYVSNLEDLENVSPSRGEEI